MVKLKGYYSISMDLVGEMHQLVVVEKDIEELIFCPTGTPVYSATDGVVISSGWNGSYGNVVMIKYTNIVIVYGHNSSLIAEPDKK